MAASAKARIFNGTSDYMQSASALTYAVNVITWSFFLWKNSGSLTDRVILESDSDVGAAGGNYLIYLPLNSQVGVYYNDNASFGNWTFSPGSSDAWHHYMIVLDPAQGSAANRLKAYVDGSSVSVTEVLIPAAAPTIPAKVLNVMARNAGASSWLPGRISALALWMSALSAGAAVALAACGDPLIIGSVAYYWPIKHVSPETSDGGVGGISLNVVGTTTAVSSCPEAAAAGLLGQELM